MDEAPLWPLALSASRPGWTTRSSSESCTWATTASPPCRASAPAGSRWCSISLWPKTGMALRIHSYTATQIHSYTAKQLHTCTATQIHSYTSPRFTYLFSLDSPSCPPWLIMCPLKSLIFSSTAFQVDVIKHFLSFFLIGLFVVYATQLCFFVTVFTDFPFCYRQAWNSPPHVQTSVKHTPTALLI